MNAPVARALSSLLLILSVFPALAGKFTPMPPELDGSMMPIDFELCSPTPVLPDSLSPLYAAYVSRHGARFLSGPKKVELLDSVLRDARSRHQLSPVGKAFLNLIDSVIIVNSDNWGELSPIGLREQVVMASRVADNFNPLSRTKVCVEAVSSYVPRCVMTMYEFCGQLARINSNLTTATAEGRKYSPWLRCFSTDKAYDQYRKDGDWREVYEEFMNRNVPPEPAKRLFLASDLSDRQLKRISMEMYEVLKSNRAAGLPAPTTQWMSVQEYRACWKTGNLNHYLRNCITPLSSLAAKATTPLALEIINAVDNGVAADNPSPAMKAYFGHAETLMPLFSLLKLPGCFALPLDYEDLDKSWKVQDVTPLGANLLILASKAPSGRIYVTLQLNGRTIAPWPDAPVHVLWSDLRSFWLSLISSY